MKKTFKKLVACLLAVLMVSTALPLSVFAASEETTLLPVASGGVAWSSSGNSRFDGSSMNIVNDGQDGNFSIGFWHYDISALKAVGATVTSASANVNVTEVGADCTGLSFYYGTNAKADAMTSGATLPSDVLGTNNAHLTSSESYYGMQLIQSIEKANVSTGTVTVDLTAAINAAIQNDLSYCTLMVTQKSYGGSGSTNGWSDTKITYNTNAISATYTVASGVAGTQALTSSAVGIIQQSQNGNRLDSSSLNIVNDAQNDNFTVGFWKFNIKALRSMGANVATAKMNVAVTAKESEAKGLSFYTATQATEALVGGDNQVSALYTGNDGAHQSRAITYFGLGDPFYSVAAGDITAGSTISVDIASAINNAIALGQDELTVMVMQSSAGQSGSSGGWTDTKISRGSVTVNCAYTINVDDIGTGVAALQKAIGIYETKMAGLSDASTGMYTNMVSAYKSYVKACAALEAYQYGGNAQAEADIDTLAQELLGNTLKMNSWVDTVTGNYQSKVPSFQNTDASTMASSYSEFYNNIIYTESCLSGNSNYDDDSSPSGLAGEFTQTEGLKVQLYFPNTILLYDGSTTGARMPVMLMGKNYTNNSKRYVFRCYPTTSGADAFNNGTTFVGNDGAFQSLSKALTNDSYAWKGGDGTNNLTFSGARGKTSRIGSSSDEAFVSAAFNNTWAAAAFGYRGYWNPYATGFRVNDDGFKYQIEQQYGAGDGIGILEVATRWAYYGSGDSSATSSYNDSVRGYLGSADMKHHIYVVNYKGIVDSTKNSTTRQWLANVSQYKEGGLLDVITALNNAVTFNVDSVTIKNISDKNKEITAIIDGAKKTPTADVDATNYANLQAEILESKKIYDKGNADNKNYSAESWAPFAEAYENAKNTVSGFYNTTDDVYGIVTKDAKTLYTTLEAARKALVLVKEVVDTTTLQYAIDNADALLANMEYFVNSSIDETALADLVSKAKTAIWGSEDDYGYDPSKIEDNETNKALVADYLDKIVTEVNKAVVDITAKVADTGYNIGEAIEAGKAYEATKDNFGNYNVLASAVQTAETYRDAIPAVNARIKDSVSAAINLYIKTVTDIKNAIDGLRPSFKLIETGTHANDGYTINTEFRESTRGDQFNYRWNHITDRIYFITDTNEFKTTINTTWTAYNKQTGTDFETILDSINVNASTDVESQEITSKAATFLNWPSDYSMPQDKINELKGNLGVVANNVTVRWDNFKVTKRSSAQGLGIDADGNVVSNDSMDTDFTSVLAVTEGLSKRPGGIMAKSGEAVFSNNVTFTVPDTSKLTVTKENKPSAISSKFDSDSIGLYMGLVYMWRYAPTNARNWTGYSYARNMYNLDVRFVNVSTLFRLIDECEDPDFLATASNYTTTSWNNLLTAVANGKGDMDYGNMTYDEIVAECDKRYEDIFNARNALKAPANNATLKDIYYKAKDVYENKKSTVKPSCWDDFATVYEEVASAYLNKYNDINVRNYDTSEQETIDALAEKLQKVYDALIFTVDFTPVDNAIDELVKSLENNKYTSESLKKLVEDVGNLTYYPLTDAERATHYTDEMDLAGATGATGIALDISQGIQLEARVTIPALKNDLVEATVDSSALEAAKTEKRAQKNDPDAYDQDAITAALDKLEAYEKVPVLGKYIMGAKYTEQTALDTDIQNALDGISLKVYSVTVDGGEKKYYEYGEEVHIASPTKSTVDWYYEMTSPSSSTPKKYMATGDEIIFVVKGDTTLTTKKATDTQTYKVTYVNGVNSLPYAVDYVPAGTTITVGTEYNTTNTYTVPQVAYYDFIDYTVGGKSASAGDSYTVNGNTVITANYTANSSAGDYKVAIVNLTYLSARFRFDPQITGLHYNDEISITQGSTASEGYYGSDLYYDKTCYATGTGVTETVYVKNGGRMLATVASRPAVYAWLEIDADDLDTWYNNWINRKIWTSSVSGVNLDSTIDMVKSCNAKVVAYGTDYTFRVSKPNTVLMAIDKTTFDKLQDSTYEGFFDESNKFDDNGASITTQSDIVISSGKFSMVSTFAVPDGSRMVETGILYSATTPSGSKTMYTGKYTLGNVSTANNLIRIKSTAHTVGNQYVCSLTHSVLKGKKVSEVPMSWVAYMIYETADGSRYTVYTPVTTPSNVDDTL